MISLNSISFVIPTNRVNNHTLKSIPKQCEVIIPKDKPLGRARNEGIKRAIQPWIILCDDDIKFSNLFLFTVLEILTNKPRAIIGLEAYYPSPFVIGRFMAFSKETWKDIGEFDIKSHGDETEWCMRAVEKGYEIVRLSRNCVYHYPHKKIKPKSEFGNLFYLLRKHPKFPFYILKLISTKMRDSSYEEEYR